jgi:hypothetical protein
MAKIFYFDLLLLFQLHISPKCVKSGFKAYFWPLTVSLYLSGVDSQQITLPRAVPSALLAGSMTCITVRLSIADPSFVGLCRLNIQ